MPKGYWIVRVDVTNPDGYAPYAQAAAPAVAKFGGRYLARGGKHEALQGTARSRNVIVEFPSYQAAVDCWNSPEYQAAKKFRDGNCEAEWVAVEGLE
ncbi:hypothetical protein IZ6_31260 [Terrihabitans soli]|uniref:DUF1330 domain-containing protein n=1 Tax=Terrihabitans soli TaxID=708113 RepID=A0A6S6QZD8_9HYPH|nr:DUF1330 domain-containing protein [Terrihabitans soli]BCJ92391.1 hypothetical protein IZ6_31260 [Terrihabitans soli]